MLGHLVRTLKSYLRAPAGWSASRFGNEIEEELAFHISERTRDLIADGLPEHDARRVAMERFGDASRIAAECHAGAVGGLALLHRMHLAMTVLLLVAVGMLWFPRRTPVDGSTVARYLPTALASMVDNDWTGDVQGRVLDERGSAIADAQVLVVVKTWPDGSYFQRAYAAVTDPQGRFSIENVHPQGDLYEVQVAAIADGSVLSSVYRGDQYGALKPVEFRLPSSGEFVLRLESEQGESLAGIEVLPQRRTDASGTMHVVYVDSAQPIVRRTDRSGRVELPYFRPGDTATVMFRVPEGDWKSRELVVPELGEVATLRASFEPTL